MALSPPSTGEKLDGSSTPAQLRVLVVDDHPITRQGIRAMIEAQPGFVVCGEADSEETAFNLLATTKPHVALLDISLRSTNGIELVKAFKIRSPATPVIVLSMHDEAFYAERALRAGAVGYVMKEHASEKIVQALRTVVSGETFFDARTKRRMQRRPHEKKAFAYGVDQLSARELQVLRLIGTGFSTREIATQLVLSAKTIDTYREHLKLKLDVPTGEELVQFAIRWSAVENASPDPTRPA
jgi:DNA-binding NarL/FixJ family response regulator